MAHPQFDAAIDLMESGNVEQLKNLLTRFPDLATARDEGNATLLIRLIDWPGYRPRSADSARVLVEAGVEVDARRDEYNGTALAGALCTKEVDVIRVLLEHQADVFAPLGWMEGTSFDLADWTCQDLGRRNDPKIQTLAELVSIAANRKVPSRAPLGGTTPLIFFNDVTAALKFYTKVLGFHVDWSHVEDDEECEPYVGISRGGAEFHLTGCHCKDRRHVGNLWVRVECDEVDVLYDEIKDQNVEILSTPKNQPWGFRELDIEDPEGNRLTFFGPTTENDN